MIVVTDGMTKWFVAVSLLVAGCGSDCDKLKKKMCEGQDEATCTAIKSYFDTSMAKGPDGEKMDSDAMELGCKMILDDKEAMKNLMESASERAKKK